MNSRASLLSDASTLPAPRPYLGETATRRQVWDPPALDDLFARFGGAVALRQASEAVVEVSLATRVDGVEVTFATDWEVDDHPEQLGLPVIQAARFGGAR